MWEICPLFMTTQTAELILQESLNEVGISAFTFQDTFPISIICFFLPEAQWSDTLNAGDTLSIYKNATLWKCDGSEPCKVGNENFISWRVSYWNQIIYLACEVA